MSHEKSGEPCESMWPQKLHVKRVAPIRISAKEFPFCLDYYTSLSSQGAAGNCLAPDMPLFVEKSRNGFVQTLGTYVDRTRSGAMPKQQTALSSRRFTELL